MSPFKVIHKRKHLRRVPETRVLLGSHFTSVYWYFVERVVEIGVSTYSPAHGPSSETEMGMSNGFTVPGRYLGLFTPFGTDT